MPTKEYSRKIWSKIKYLYEMILVQTIMFENIVSFVYLCFKLSLEKIIINCILIN